MEHVIQWSAINRDQYRSQAQSQTFDLIIIGGGITGAGICREAALHHLSFIILDKNDFGFGYIFSFLKNGSWGIPIFVHL